MENRKERTEARIAKEYIEETKARPLTDYVEYTAVTPTKKVYAI
jgi:hypothetical protein